MPVPVEIISEGIQVMRDSSKEYRIMRRQAAAMFAHKGAGERSHVCILPTARHIEMEANGL